MSRKIADIVLKAEDPIVAGFVSIIGLAGFALLLLTELGGEAHLRDTGLKALGGTLLLLSAYFTARNLRQSAHATFLDRLMQAAELLGSERSDVRRAAGEAALRHMLRHARGAAEREAVSAVLEAAGVDVPAPSGSPVVTTIAPQR